MGSQINDLVAMGDVETLYELMAEDDDWMNQLDAAEGLVKLGDRRGLDFLLSAEDCGEKEICEAAREILAAPQIASRRQELEAEEEREFKRKVESAKTRLQRGRKVFRYKMAYLPSGSILSGDSLPEGFQVPQLDEFGLEGWEVIDIILRRKQSLVGSADDHSTGIYFLLKKELAPEDSPELDEI
ncbi:MAG TPA: hypothetical protein VLZ89_02495 [Anaerolineales bacterium]|nr:hypothetical protein [Anaerolineales bacterium]